MLDLLIIAYIIVVAGGYVGASYLRDYELKEVTDKEGH